MSDSKWMFGSISPPAVVGGSGPPTQAATVLRGEIGGTACVKIRYSDEVQPAPDAEIAGRKVLL